MSFISQVASLGPVEKDIHFGGGAALRGILRICMKEKIQGND